MLGLYAWLTFERFSNAVGGRTAYRELVLPGAETGRAGRVAANLNNQFQAPVFFHIIALTLWLADLVSSADLILAWIFVAGRMIHTLVHAFTANVIARGLVFSINFTALCGLWLCFFIRVL
ncbi:MAPEG family protein [Maricaulaceae bacterium NA33B04]|nr:MAPEG family protein [Maricaulaceae bacterium NA33B04]